MWMLLAQIADNSLSGGAGWVGAGLLGLVLSWLLLKHIPEKDKQLKDLIESHAIQMDKIHDDCRMERQEDDTRHDASLKSAFMQFDHSLKEVLERSSKDAGMMTAGIQSELKSINITVDALGKIVEALGRTVQALSENVGKK